jgi:hypothetical protein
MHRHTPWIVATAAVASLALASCGGSSRDGASHEEPAKVSAIAGSDLKRLTLTPRAVERLDIRIVKVAAPGRGSAPKRSIPYSAVIYDTSGAAFAYTSPRRHVFERARIAIEAIRGNIAVLTDGPPAGTPVVSVGAAELYGEELGVGH